MSQFFESGGQNIGASASTPVLPVNIQSWFPLGLTGLISLLSKGLSRVFSSTAVRKHQFFGTQPFLWSNSHIHTWLREKPLDNILHLFSLWLGLCPNLSSPFLSWVYLDCIIERDGEGGRRLMFSFSFGFFGVPARSQPTLPDTFTNVALVILTYRCEKRGPERLRNMSGSHIWASIEPMVTAFKSWCYLH